MERSVAVVLRGPPCGGKTSIAEMVLNRFRDDASLAILDRFWWTGEKRYLGHCRYWDLVDERRLLIVELGYGEPRGNVFLGATRNPKEWLTILEAAGRKVLFFQLWAPWEEVRARLIKRGSRDPDASRPDHARYDDGQVCSTASFMARIGGGYTEKRIDTKETSLNATFERVVAELHLE